MSTRLVYHAALQSLEEDLSRMAGLVTAAVEDAVRAATAGDDRLAETVAAGDEVINSAYGAIENRAVALLATQQPMAGDLRTILSVLGASVDLERAGDHAKGIAAGYLRGGRRLPIEMGPRIGGMSRSATEMLDRAVRSLRERDVAAARAVGQGDAAVDAMFESLRQDLLGLMLLDPAAIPELEMAEWCAKSLERTADHATNIAERVVFLCTGDVVELNT